MTLQWDQRGILIVFGVLLFRSAYVENILTSASQHEQVPTSVGIV